MTKSERIAFVCPRLAQPGTAGGAETLLRNLAERAAAAGREVHFLTTCARNHFSWENEREPGTEETGGMMIHYFPVDTHRNIERFLETQEAIRVGAEVTDEDERDWIDHNVNSRALCDHLARHGGVYHRILLGPYLFGLIWHASQIRPDRSFLIPCLHDEPFARLRLMRTMFSAVAGCLFNTEPERVLAQNLFDLSSKHSHVVGMGLDGFDADPNAFALQHEIRGPYVLYSGRREPLKGTPMLIDFVHAFRERTAIDLKVVFTGSGRIEAPPELGPHVIDVGFVSEKEKLVAMAGATAFVHPSVYESLGIVLLEAWLAGTPCLVSAYSEVLRYQCVTSGGGLWFRTYPEFEAQLRLLIENTRLRDLLGRHGREYVRREYDWSIVEQRFFEAIDAK